MIDENAGQAVTDSLMQQDGGHRAINAAGQPAADLALSRVQLGESPQLDQLNANQRNKLKALEAEYRSRIEASEKGVVQAQQAIDGAKAQFEASTQALRIREGMLADIEPLVKEGAMARSQYLKEKQEKITLEGEVKNQRASLRRLEAGLEEARQKLLNTKALTQIDFSTKVEEGGAEKACLLYTSTSPRDRQKCRVASSG